MFIYSGCFGVTRIFAYPLSIFLTMYFKSFLMGMGGYKEATAIGKKFNYYFGNIIAVIFKEAR